MINFDEIFIDCTKYGIKLKSNEYLVNGKNIIIDQGQKYIAGYTNLDEGLYTKVPALIFGDHTRCIKYVDKPFFIGADGVKIIKTRLNNSNYKYWYYALKNIQIPNTGYNRHFKWLKGAKFKIHNTDEQQKIVYILDNLTGLISKKEKLMELLDELIKSRFIEQFGDPVVNEKGWDTKSLLEMGYCKNGMNFRYEDTGVEINCLGVGDFKDYSTIVDTSVLPIVSLNKIPSDDYLLKDDDIVFVRSNGNKALVGRSVAVYPGKVPTTFSGFCIRYRKTDDVVNIPYLLRVLKTESIRKKMAGRGANIQNLNQQILGTLIIPVPPIKLQNQFASFVEQTDKSKVAIQKSIDELQQLFDSLMQEYFG